MAQKTENDKIRRTALIRSKSKKYFEVWISLEGREEQRSLPGDNAKDVLSLAWRMYPQAVGIVVKPAPRREAENHGVAIFKR